MSATVSVVLILSIIMIYCVLLRIYSVLFQITGLPKEKAKFQVISLLTNCGFTTRESEIITEVPARRKIAQVAMITGYVFSVLIVTLFINLINNIVKDNSKASLKFIGIAFGIFIVTISFFNIPIVVKLNRKIIEKISYMFISKNKNIIKVLDMFGKHAMVEIYLHDVPDILKDVSLYDSNLKKDYSINIIMIERKGRNLDVSGQTILNNNDKILCYGTYQNIKDIFGYKFNTNETLLTEISKENTIDLMDNYGIDAMCKVNVNSLPSFLKDKKLCECNLREKYGINIMLINRSDMILKITKDSDIKENDELIVFGPYKKIKQIFLDKSE